MRSNQRKKNQETEKGKNNNIIYENEYDYEDSKDENEDNIIEDNKRNLIPEKKEINDDFILNHLNAIILNYYDHGFNILGEEIDYQNVPDKKNDYSKLGEKNFGKLVNGNYSNYNSGKERKTNLASNEEDIDNSFNDKNNGNKDKKRKISNNNANINKINNIIKDRKFRNINQIQYSMEKTDDLIYKNNTKNEGKIRENKEKEKKNEENKVKEDEKCNNKIEHKEEDENNIYKIEGIIDEGLLYKYENTCLKKSDMKKLGENIKKVPSIFNASSIILLISNQKDSYMYISLPYVEIKKIKILRLIKYNDMEPKEVPNSNLYELFQLCDYNQRENYLVIKGEIYFQYAVKNFNNQLNIEKKIKLNADNSSKNHGKNIPEDKNQNNNVNLNNYVTESPRSFKWIYGGDETYRKKLVFRAFGKNNVYVKSDLNDIWPYCEENQFSIIVFPIEKYYDRVDVEFKLVDWCKEESIEVQTERKKISIHNSIFVVLSQNSFNEYFENIKNKPLWEINFEFLNCDEYHDKNDIDDFFYGNLNYF